MKTALQISIDHFKNTERISLTPIQICYILENYLGQEKQQIIDACNAGLSGIPRSAEKYFSAAFAPDQIND